MSEQKVIAGGQVWTVGGVGDFSESTGVKCGSRNLGFVNWRIVMQKPDTFRQFSGPFLFDGFTQFSQCIGVGLSIDRSVFRHILRQ